MSLRIHGNRLLKTLPGETTRPTLAKVRQAVFNIWQGTIDECRWLDLCAGSGSMGAEALCRGAALAVGIEQSPQAATIVQQNWQQVAKPEQTIRVIRSDVRQGLKSLAGQQFDRIYFDPPYTSGLYESVLAAIVDFELLTPVGEIAAEHHPKATIPTPMGLEIVRQKTYGNSALTFYGKT